MAAPDVVVELVERFRRNRATYIKAGYNETQLRLEFLNPFFSALGWDVDNKAGYLPSLQEVSVEFGQDVRGSSKRADYIFRVGPQTKFFVEAKKPGVNLKDDPRPAYQLRSYAYSAKLPLSILTDFEEFGVYDGRLLPKEKDGAAVGRVLYLTCEEYVARWDELAGVFGREAVWKGAFDEFAGKPPKASLPVDKNFLKDMEEWRKLLATNIANRNRDRGLDAGDLNFAVQAVLDRIIFLRVCEDRGLEAEGRLKAAAAGEDVYQRLGELFREADARYNSGLFHFKKEKDRATPVDALTPGLAVDDKVLKAIVRDLYDSPYVFSVMPADILGQVYEQFLGKVIRVMPAGGAKVEDKPEVKKAGGVYYTPTYIVDYIVANTVGKLLEGCATPAAAAKLRILDPACGSGSFLLGAYQKLLDWHRDWYAKEGAAKHADELFADGSGGLVTYRLTAGEKKRILLNNIYGVDIDPQAVEVTKLSLLLKALEDESAASLNAQQQLYKERALPDLGANIKCGNSLIGPDYFEGRLMPDEEERERVNPFDWEKEFPQVFGVDVSARQTAGGIKTVGLSPLSGPPSESDELGWWFVTFFTHNSRTSERMARLKIKTGTPLVFEGDDLVTMAREIAAAVKKNAIPVLALNVLPDHVHMIVGACSEGDLNEKIRKIKGASARAYAKTLGLEPGVPIWARKFNRKLLREEEALGATSVYIANNHRKHAERWGEELTALYETKIRPIVAMALTSARAAEGIQTVGLSPLSKSPLSKSPLSKSPLSKTPLSNPGFDAVIGNPPYVRQEGLADSKDYLTRHYESFTPTADLYVSFIEKAINLTRPDGRFSFIVSNKWMRARYGEGLRRFIKRFRLEQLVDFGELKVFENAATFPLIMVVVKKPFDKRFRPTIYAPIKRLDFGDLAAEVKEVGYEVSDYGLADTGFALVEKGVLDITEKMKAGGAPFGDYIAGEIYDGLKTGFNEAFVIDRETRDRLIKKDKKSAEIIKPFVVGDDVRRYCINVKERYIILTKIGVDMKRYPAVFEWLKIYEKQLEKRWDKGKHWWELRACDYYEEFLKPKIVWPEIAKEPRFAFDTSGVFHNNKAFFSPRYDLYLLAVLNSRLAWLFLKNVCSCLGDVNRGGRLELRRVHVSQIPIPKADVARHDKMVSLVERMLELHKKKAAAKTPPALARLERDIAAADEAIDKLVYELYGLSEEEIKTVEGNG